MAVEGAANPAYDELIAGFPTAEGKTTTVDGVDVAALLPPGRGRRRALGLRRHRSTTGALEPRADRAVAVSHQPPSPLGSRSLTLGS